MYVLKEFFLFAVGVFGGWCLLDDSDLGEAGFGYVAGGFSIVVVAVGLGVVEVEEDATFDAVVFVKHPIAVVDDHDVVDVLTMLGEVGASYGVG